MTTGRRSLSPGSVLLVAAIAALGAGSAGCCGKVRGMLSKSKGSPTTTTTTTTKKSGVSGPQAAPGEVTITFGTSDFTVSTGGRGRFLTFDKEGRLLMTFDGLPWGTKVKAGAEEVTVEGGKPTQLRPDIRAALGASSTELGANFDPKLTITLTLPDGRSGSAPVPPQRVNTYSISQVLQEASGKGIAFEGEAPDAKRDTAFLTYGSRVIGRKGLVRDIDLVVTLKKGAKDGTMRSVVLELFEGEALAFDRRTGAEVARKTLPPNSVCPMTLYQAKDDPTADSNLPSTATEKWALTLLKK
jgi:hypothetical protein